MASGAERRFFAVGTLTAVVFGAAIAAALTRTTEALPPPVGSVRVEQVEAAVVVRADGTAGPLSDGDLLRAGDEVQVSTGTVALRLPSGALLEGRGRDSGGEPTRLSVDEVPELLAGHVLASGQGGATVEVDGTRYTLEPAGAGEAAATIRRSLSVTAATYAGTLTVESAGQRRTVPALRELTVSTVGRLPAMPRPLQYDPADPWDLRYLAEVIALDGELASTSSLLTAAYGGVERGPAFFTTVLPVLAQDGAFSAALVDGAATIGDALVGAAITALGHQGTFTQRWVDVFAFREEGAGWGMVARDHDVGTVALLDTLRRALPAGDPGQVASGPTTVVPSAGGGAGGVDEPAVTVPPVTVPPVAVPPVTAPPAPPPATVPPVTAPPGDPNQPGDVLPDLGVPLVDDLVEPIDDLLARLLGIRR